MKILLLFVLFLPSAMAQADKVSCGDDPDMYCVHGGSCITGGTFQSGICNCTGAYAGIHCGSLRPDWSGSETVAPTPTPRVDTAQCGGDPDFYCLNGGECISGGSIDTGICNCTSQYTGFHCSSLRSSPIDCDPSTAMDCNGRGTCTVGVADLSNIPKDNNGVPVFSETNINGMYCRDCEAGFSGINCERTTEFCDSNSHVCFHNGVCVLGVIQSTQENVHVCDCRQAIENGVRYIGLYCETPTPSGQPDDLLPSSTPQCDGGSEYYCLNGGTCITNGDFNTGICSCPSDWDGLHCGNPTYDIASNVPNDTVVAEDNPDNLNTTDFYEGRTECIATSEYCLNGGKCNDNPSEQLGICDCAPGFTGYHCEYRRVTPDAVSPSDDVNQDSDQCSLTCLNGGYCEVGYRNATTAELAFNSSFNPLDQVSTFEHCVCRDGFSGAFCERTYTVCGNLHCFHGSTCMEHPETNEQFCSCNNNGTNAFGGIGCQMKSTSFCTKTLGLNGHQFCTNDGKCVPTDVEGIYSCSCVNGFHGPHCEFPEEVSEPEWSRSCSLSCNGGKCVEGMKDYGILSTFNSLDLSHILNVTASPNLEHCICPTGFTGLQCDQKVEVCPDEQSVCFHSGTCVPNGDEFKCNCDAGTTHGVFIAGLYCQHNATEVCDQVQARFCTNGGICKDSGCECPSGYIGGKCEYIQDLQKTASIPDDDNYPIDPNIAKVLPPNYQEKANETVALSAAIVGSLAVIAIFLVVMVTGSSEEILPDEPIFRSPPMAAFPPSHVDIMDANAEDGSSRNLTDDMEEEKTEINELI